jgi:hypothetical protein
MKNCNNCNNRFSGLSDKCKDCPIQQNIKAGLDLQINYEKAKS